MERVNPEDANKKPSSSQEEKENEVVTEVVEHVNPEDANKKPSSSKEEKENVFEA